jgi:FtsH-binding integral membrane protein
MSYFQTQSAQSSVQPVSAEVERVFLRTVFAWMVLGVGTTAGIAAWFGSNKQVMDALQTHSSWLFIAIGVQLALVFGLSFGINKISSGLAAVLFLVYAAVTGVVFSVILGSYSTTSVASAFAGATGVFGGMAAYGYFTKSDLSKLRPILFGALIGLIVASVVFLFTGGQTFNLILGYAGVIIFAGLTAWDMQQIKKFAAGATDEESGKKLAIFGALSLYLNFINIFLSLLRIFGRS